MVIKHRLDHPRSAGIGFPELYLQARQNFSATSEGALRKHITEFQSHDLVRKRQGPSGQKVFWCRFPRETLQLLLQTSDGLDPT